MNESVKKGCTGAAVILVCVCVIAVERFIAFAQKWDEVGGEHDVRSQEPWSKEIPGPNDHTSGRKGPMDPKETDDEDDTPSRDDAAKKRAEKSRRSGKGPVYPDTPVAKRGNTTLTSFPGAKRNLMKIHGDKPRTFYCRCGFEPTKSIDLKECGYSIRKNASRAARVEFEHVVPASVFGHAFDEWTKGHPTCERKGKRFKGRKCAQKASRRFQLMESDMHNLQPAVGEVNGDRLHYPMAEIPGEAREYGSCDVEIEGQRVEPAARIRGDIARTYFYMDWAYPEYGIISSDAERAMFEKWAAADPVDRWERKRAKRIAEVQGNVNPFVE